MKGKRKITLMKMNIDRMTLEFYYFSKYYLYVEMNKGYGISYMGKLTFHRKQNNSRKTLAVRRQRGALGSVERRNPFQLSSLC